MGSTAEAYDMEWEATLESLRKDLTSAIMSEFRKGVTEAGEAISDEDKLELARKELARRKKEGTMDRKSIDAVWKGIDTVQEARIQKERQEKAAKVEAGRPEYEALVAKAKLARKKGKALTREEIDRMYELEGL